MLARMVWGTYAVKIEVQMGNCLIVEGSKMLTRMVWGTYNHQQYLGNVQINLETISGKLPLSFQQQHFPFCCGLLIFIRGVFPATAGGGDFSFDVGVSQAT